MEDLTYECLVSESVISMKGVKRLPVKSIMSRQKAVKRLQEKFRYRREMGRNEFGKKRATDDMNKASAGDSLSVMH